MRRPAPGVDHGFTLLELTVVLSIIGALVAVSVPAFEKYLRKARTADAVVDLGTIAVLERSYFVDHRAYLACPAAPAAVPKGVEVAWPGGEAWDKIGYHPEGAVRFQYEVELGAKGFVARARGDLDGDGLTSLFEIHGPSTAGYYKERELE